MKPILICTQGSIGILVIRKLFEIGYAPEDIHICTYMPLMTEHEIHHDKTNKCFIEFMDYYGISYMYWINSQHLLHYCTVHQIELLFSFSWKYIFKAPLIGSNIKMINCHPGILPNYRGCFSIPWSIINNEEFVGFTYHLIDDDIDTGKILMKWKTSIRENDNAFTLHHRVMDNAVNQLETLLLHLDSYVISEIPKEISGYKYYKNEFPKINPSWDAAQLERYKKASYFPPHS